MGVRDGTQMTVAGILQTPQFMYTPTFADGGPADSFALAARLALFLWDSIPDPELFQAAAENPGGGDRRRGTSRRGAGREALSSRLQHASRSGALEWSPCRS